MEGESVRRNFTPFLIPVGGPLRRPGAGGCCLRATPAGSSTAFTAEGIYYAMVSGELAARAIIETPRRAGRQSLARRYRRACDDEIGSELRDSVLMQRYFFADRRRIARVIGGADGTPATVTGLDARFCHGPSLLSSIRRRMLTRSPPRALRLMRERAQDARDHSSIRRMRQICTRDPR